MIEKHTFAPRPLTGRTVLLCFLAFFGVVAGVNAIMISAAVITFGGVEASGGYRHGLAFKNEIAAARAQGSRRWQVRGNLLRNPAGEALLEVEARDAAGRALVGVKAEAWLAHPAVSRLDRPIELAAIGAGRFRGTAATPEGHWDLVIELHRGDERVFRSKSRIVLR